MDYREDPLRQFSLNNNVRESQTGSPYFEFLRINVQYNVRKVLWLGKHGGKETCPYKQRVWIRVTPHKVFEKPGRIFTISPA